MERICSRSKILSSKVYTGVIRKDNICTNVFISFGRGGNIVSDGKHFRSIPNFPQGKLAMSAVGEIILGKNLLTKKHSLSCFAFTAFQDHLTYRYFELSLPGKWVNIRMLRGQCVVHQDLFFQVAQEILIINQHRDGFSMPKHFKGSKMGVADWSIKTQWYRSFPWDQANTGAQNMPDDTHYKMVPT